jgi:hypothetical protein
MRKTTNLKKKERKIKKCSHFQRNICVYCTVTGGENYRCSLFKRENKDSLYDNISISKLSE